MNINVYYYICQPEGPKSSETPVAVSYPSSQNLVSKWTDVP